MSVPPATNQSAHNSVWAFYNRHRMALRVGRHVVMWVVLWLYDRYYITPRIFRDNQSVVNIASLAILVQTAVLFYIMGYWALPNLLYKKRYLSFILTLGSAFFVVYQLNYVLFYYLQHISSSSVNGNDTYAEKIFKMIKDAGWTGCFTNSTVFFWNYGYGFFLLTIILFVKAFKDVIDYQKQLVAAERDRFALELDFLKAQVNPHFLFNTLNSVYARVFDSDEQAADLVLRLSELMRYNLYETDAENIALDKELGYVQNYLDLERNRLSDQYVVIDYEQSGGVSAYQIAPLLLIAFVENAFKHGIKAAAEPAYVQVNATVADSKLVFRVENSVPHRREASLTEPLANSDRKSGGIGLGNVRRRLDALYKDRYELVVIPTESTYTVVLTMQLETISTVASPKV